MEKDPIREEQKRKDSFFKNDSIVEKLREKRREEKPDRLKIGLVGSYDIKKKRALAKNFKEILDKRVYPSYETRIFPEGLNSIEIDADNFVLINPLPLYEFGNQITSEEYACDGEKILVSYFTALDLLAKSRFPRRNRDFKILEGMVKNYSQTYHKLFLLPTLGENRTKDDYIVEFLKENNIPYSDLKSHTEKSGIEERAREILENLEL